MLRAVSSQALEQLATYRRDVFKLLRTSSSAPLSHQTVLTSESGGAPPAGAGPAAPPPCAAPPPRAAPPPPPARPPPPPRRAWTVGAAALALTASVGGVYFYQKLNDAERSQPRGVEGDGAIDGAPEPPPASLRADDEDEDEDVEPRSAELMPRRVDYLVVGGGAGAAAALRALRAGAPSARVLVAAPEPALPYMRPPLTKELWREPEPAPTARVDELAFRPATGRRRPLAFEPRAFYTPVERLGAEGAGGGAAGGGAAGGGAAVARGWRLARLDPARREAELARGGQRAVVRYSQCLVTEAARPRAEPGLAAARAAGAAGPLHRAADAARVWRSLSATPAPRDVLVVGDGVEACEFSAVLAERLRESPTRVWLALRGEGPLEAALPGFLSRQVAAQLERLGVHLLRNCEVTDSRMEGATAVVTLTAGGRRSELRAGLVVECAGLEPDPALLAATGAEIDPTNGGIMVNRELQALTGLYASGDAASVWRGGGGAAPGGLPGGPPGGARRRDATHDHAVQSARLAADNMVAAEQRAAPRLYEHHSMFWCDVGRLGFEAIGVIDSSLPTVSVFPADAVVPTVAERGLARGGGGDAGGGGEGTEVVPKEGEAERQGASEGDGEEAEGEGEAGRGVVLYVAGRRVVGVLLWNLFNRLHVARQVVTEGHFEDLFEVAKLFTPHEDD